MSNNRFNEIQDSLIQVLYSSHLSLLLPQGMVIKEIIKEKKSLWGKSTMIPIYMTYGSTFKICQTFMNT